jgi:hypothetical protein
MSENPWIEWAGGSVPIEGTDARGQIQFVGESREHAEARSVSILDYWPWFGEDEKPCVLAYRVIDAALSAPHLSSKSEVRDDG